MGAKKSFCKSIEIGNTKDKSRIVKTFLQSVGSVVLSALSALEWKLEWNGITLENVIAKLKLTMDLRLCNLFVIYQALIPPEI